MTGIDRSTILAVLQMRKERLDWRADLFKRFGMLTEYEMEEDRRLRAEESALLNAVPEGGPGSR